MAQVFRLLVVIAVLAVGVLARPIAAHAVTIERIKSPAGIEAWLVRDTTVPLVSIHFAFRGGAALDPAGRDGLAELTAQIMDEGAGELDSQAYQRALEDISAQLSFNAGRDHFRGSLKVLNEFRARAIDLMALAMTKPRFDAEPVERIRARTIASLKRQSEEPNRIAWQTLFRTLFPDHAYGRPVSGTPESVAAITVEEMRALVGRQLARDRLVVGVVGDITAADLAPFLDRAFAGLPATGAPRSARDAAINAGDRLAVVRKPIPQSVVAFGQPGIKRDDPDFYAAHVMNYILGGGGFSSRLYEIVREQRGLAYSVHSSLAPMAEAGLVLGGVATQNARVRESLDLIRSEWRRMAEAGVTETELANAKTYLNGSFPLRLDSTGAVANLLVDMQIESLGIDYIDKRKDYIEGVSLADIRRVARRLLDADRLTVVVVGDPDGLESKP
ncbi:MAG: insulinase family protein [Alphaproteobacteria bacterium]|nr:insulinase family protein [Alphaproteobacteria bacterium]